jgi:hypothetical protein
MAQEGSTGNGSRPDWIETTPEHGNGDASGEHAASSEPNRIPQWVPVEPEHERTPQEATDLHILRRQARASSRGEHQAAIRRIDRVLEQNPTARGDPALVTVLRELALGNAVRESRGAGSTDFPLVRMRATKLLGRMAGSEPKRILFEILEHESESAVLAQAFRSLAMLRIPPDAAFAERATDVISRKLAGPAIDAQLALAILDSVSTLDRVGVGVQSAELYRALIRIALQAPNAAVRKRAYEVLDRLRAGQHAGQSE